MGLQVTAAVYWIDTAEYATDTIWFRDQRTDVCFNIILFPSFRQLFAFLPYSRFSIFVVFIYICEYHDVYRAA